MVRVVVRFVRALVFVAVGALGAGAQAVEGTAAIRGVVVAEGGPVAGAAVEVEDRDRNGRWGVVSGHDGRFAVERLPAGRPFHLLVRAIGYQPGERQLPSLEPGRVLQLEVRLTRVAGALPTVSVVSEVPRQEGAGYALPGDALRNLPLFNRSLAGLVQLIPQALGRGTPSFGAQNIRFNAVRVDGTIGSDVTGFGLTPGNQAGAPPLSLDALAGVRVVTAPMDVRYGDFSGGGIELETRSGSNQSALSVRTAYQEDGLVGTYRGSQAPGLDFRQVTVTAEGPIVRDRLHYLVTVEALRRDSTYQLSATANVPPGTEAFADRVRTAILTRYGLDAGGSEVPTTRQPNASVFAKVDWNSSGRHVAEMSYQGLRASSDGFNRGGLARGTGWMLSGSGWQSTARVHALRGHARSILGAVRNEAYASLQYVRDLRDSRLHAPLFNVAIPSGGFVAAGSFRNAQGTLFDQHVAEIGDDVSWATGMHEVTVGARIERFSFIDNLLLLRWGAWTFDNVEALEAGRASRYDIGLPIPSDGSSYAARFRARSLAGYVQDRWTPSGRVQVTAGMRLETTGSDAPRTNALLLSPRSPLDLDTGVRPLATRLLPRLGATFTLDEGGRTHLRVGVGRFATRAPYVWVSNAMNNTGVEQRTLTCASAAGVPAPVVDLRSLPTACTGSTALANSAAIVAFLPGTRFPVADKAIVGLDRGLGAGWTASLDLSAERTRDGLILYDRNLVESGRDVEGRVLYGRAGPSGLVPVRADPSLPPTLVYQNVGNGGRAYSASLMLARRWSDRRFVQAGYQWLRATEPALPGGPSAAASYGQAPIDGSPSSRRLTRSLYDVPHSTTALVATPVGTWVDAVVTLRAQSGLPFSYVIGRGDANGDTVTTNDLAWIPRDASDIVLRGAPAAWDTLDAYIAATPCLARQRGHLAVRNSCRNPSFTVVDLRVSHEWRWRAGRTEVSGDIFNLANFIDHARGRVREVTGREGAPLLDVAGWDAAQRRPIYALRAFPRAETIPDLSRWRVQLGIRYRR